MNFPTYKSFYGYRTNTHSFFLIIGGDEPYMSVLVDRKEIERVISALRLCQNADLVCSSGPETDRNDRFYFYFDSMGKLTVQSIPGGREYTHDIKVKRRKMIKLLTAIIALESPAFP